ncbi:hypothetical protein FR801_27020 (plasmid) [Citrobacter freundii]|nr:hypothetical protein FR801_27020 [Citrobacter freundii]
MRRLWAIALVGAIVILVAVMILSDKAPDKPKEGELRSINTPSHGVGMLWSTKTGHRVRVFPVSVF